MDNRDFAREVSSPPPYEPLKEEIEFHRNPGQQLQSTVVTIMPDSPPVRDHIIWSLFNTIYMNFCCLGFLAFVFSVKARDRKLLGDKSGALSYSSTARSLNIAATTLSILSIVIVIVIAIIPVVLVVKNSKDTTYDPYGN